MHWDCLPPLLDPHQLHQLAQRLSPPSQYVRSSIVEYLQIPNQQNMRRQYQSKILEMHHLKIKCKSESRSVFIMQDFSAHFGL